MTPPKVVRRWSVRWMDSGWWFTVGIHFDPRHPMLTFYLSRIQLNIGRFYVVCEIDGEPLIPAYCWNNPVLERTNDDQS